MYFKVSFETDNDAFTTEGILIEISRILNNISDELNDGKSDGSIYDINGNRIGRFGLYVGRKDSEEIQRISSHVSRSRGGSK